MRRPDWSLGLSLSIHAAILVAAVVALPKAQQFEVKETPYIPIELITDISDKASKAATKKDAPKPKPEEKVAPPKTEEPKKDTPPPPPPEPKPEPKPEPPKPEPKPEPPKPAPDPDALKQLIDKTEPPPPKPQPKPKPEKKPDKPKKKEKAPELDLDNIAALIDKSQDAQPKPSDQEGSPLDGPVNSLSGTDAANSADLVAYLASRTSECWNPPTGVAEAQGLLVKLRIEFAEDGSVVGTPQIVETSSHPLAGVAAASAVRAVMMCSPYDKLPRERYDEWRDTIFNFNPAQMFGQ